MAASDSSEEEARSARGRGWKLRLLSAMVILASMGVIGRKSAPWLDREIHLRLAERAIAQGRLLDAEDRLDLMIREEPTRTRPRLLMVQVLRREGRVTEAEEVLQRTIELGLPVEEGRREFALLMAGQDFARAEKSLRRILAKQPGDLEVRQALEGRSPRERGRPASSAP